MEEQKNITEDLSLHAAEYVDTFYQLSKVKVLAKSSIISSKAVVLLLILVFIFLSMFFAGIAISIYIGYLLANPIAGYLVVSALYLLIIFLILALRKKFIEPLIKDYVVKKFYEQ